MTKLFLLIALPALFISGCTESKASSSKTIECETVVSPIEWQSDTVCGVDKLGRQMVSIGGFQAMQLPAPEADEKTVGETLLEKQNRTGCVSISRHCTITE